MEMPQITRKVLTHPEDGEPITAEDWARKVIKTNGQKVVTEDGQVTKEIDGMTLRILYPDVGWPISGSGWKIPALDEYYQNEIISPDNPTGFEYTYGERLNSYFITDMPPVVDLDPDTDSPVMLKFKQVYVNQIKNIIAKLKANRTTRRSVGCTWNPLIDNEPGFHPPCLMVVDFKIRGEALNLFAYFRSWDIGQAMPQNLYGLYRLQQYIAEQLDAELGSIQIMTASAHIYLNPGEE